MPGSLPTQGNKLQIMTNERRLIQILKILKHTDTEQSPPDKTGLSPSQVNIMDEISFAGELTVRELAERLHLTPPTISVGVKKLEKASLLIRESHKDDGRIVRLMLSDKGRNLHKRIEEYRIGKVEKILNRLNLHEQNQMLLLLEKAIGEEGS